MPSTYTLIASNTLTSTASIITFSGISNAFTDLILKVSMRDTAVTDYRNIQFRFNGSTTTYSQTEFQGTGISSSSTRRTGATYLSSDNTIPAGTSTANTFNNAEIYIPNYTSSAIKPSSTFAAGENNAATAYIMCAANLWSTSAAITQISFIADGVHAVGSSFYLYGISKS
jgi:hypothetical protein